MGLSFAARRSVFENEGAAARSGERGQRHHLPPLPSMSVPQAPQRRSTTVMLEEGTNPTNDPTMQAPQRSNTADTAQRQGMLARVATGLQDLAKPERRTSLPFLLRGSVSSYARRGSGCGEGRNRWQMQRLGTWHACLPFALSGRRHSYTSYFWADRYFNLLAAVGQAPNWTTSFRAAILSSWMSVLFLCS